jgi:uncharacterized membrane protein YeiH
VLLGTVTAVGGGTVRDVVLRRVPLIFGGGHLYATCALVASGLLVVFHQLGVTVLGPLIATVAGAVLYLLARWRSWTLPEQLPTRRSRNDRRRSGEE